MATPVTLRAEPIACGRIPHRERLLLSTALSSAVITVVGLGSLSPAQAGTNVITPDGRTQTQLQVNGATTNITTGSVQGRNAFNSFTQFSVAAGNTVNLQLPTGATNLLNIVRGGPVDIEGTLNAYKNGQIGGHVYFADPFGFLVGSGGVLNVGGLTVTTPTADFLERVIDKNGVIDATATAQLMHGTVPISPDGVVAIRGTVNSATGISINAQQVSVDGTLSRSAALHDALFNATVNTKGMPAAGGMIARDEGVIEIVAAGDASITGSINADGGANMAAGRVDVTAGGNIALGSTASLSAKGQTSGGGSVKLLAGNNLSVAPGAQVNVSAGTSGNGGTIEISAINTMTLGGGQFSAGAPNGQAGSVLFDPTNLVISGDTDDTISGSVPANGANPVTPNGGSQTIGNIILNDGTSVTLTASNSIAIDGTGEIDTRNAGGTSGNISIDAPTITLAAGSQLLADADCASCTGGTVTLGITAAQSIDVEGLIRAASVSATATSSITVGGIINTRNLGGTDHSDPTIANISPLDAAADSTKIVTASAGNSGAITLTAPSITVANGGALLAFVETGSTYAAGDITLTATQNQWQESGAVSATAGISVAGTINGGNISAISTASADSDFAGSSDAIAETTSQSVLASLLGLNGGWVSGTATATTTIEGTAIIAGAGTVDIDANGEETARDFAPTITTGATVPPFALSVVVGELSGTVTAQVLSGAQLSAGGELTVAAKNSATMSLGAFGLNTQDTPIDGTAAASSSTVNTTASIATGAVISQAGGVHVLAHNENSFLTLADSFAFGGGKAAAAVAVSQTSISATAHDGTSLGTSTSSPIGAGGVVIEADSNTSENSTSSSTIVGDNFLAGAIRSAGNFFMGGAGALAEGTANTEGSDAGLKVGAAVTVATSTQNASADISEDPSGTAAPVVYSAGPVAVFSDLIDAGVRSNAGSEVNSDADTGNGASQSISVGLSVGMFTHNSNAFIGKNVHVTAPNIGVGALTNMPFTNSWTTFSSLTDVLSHLNGNAGVVSNILTSDANAASESQDLGFAGSVNLLTVTDNTTAWVGSGAKLTQGTETGGTPLSNFVTTTDIPTGDDNNKYQIVWTAPVAIQASNTVQTVDVGGNIALPLSFTGSSSQSDTGTAVGGSLDDVIYTNTTLAGVSDGVVIQAANAVSVAAASSDTVLSLAPTSGAGGGTGINGIVSVIAIQNVTHASISADAEITAPAIAVNATQDLSVFSLGGAIVSSQAAGVGIGIAFTELATDTRAYIGDNSTDIANSAASADDPDAGTTIAPQRGINTDALSLLATTEGVDMTLAVAGAVADSSESSGPTFGKKLTSLTGISSLLDKLTSKSDTAAEDDTPQEEAPSGPSYGLSISGSLAVAETGLVTAADMQGAIVGPLQSGDSSSTLVQALDNTMIDTGSGSGSLTLSSNPNSSFSAGVAGAIAVGISNNATTAYISSSTLTGVTNVTVQALSGGEETVVGIGLSATSSTNTKTAGEGDASISVAQVEDSVSGYIDFSTLTGPSDGQAVTVQAFQNTKIGIGGGALFGGGSAGIGAAITYADIEDPSSGAAGDFDLYPSGGPSVDAHLYYTSITGYQTLTVLAVDTSNIGAGAAVAGFTPSGFVFSGAIVVDEILVTTSATVTGSAQTIDVGGDVTVSADGSDTGGFHALLSAAEEAASQGSSTVTDQNFDFTGAVLGEADTGGASIIGIAGSLSRGTNAVGLALVDNTIAQHYTAQIDDVLLTSDTGSVMVSAGDAATILGVAAGLGSASGTFAGVGSISVNKISDTVTAEIGADSATTADTQVTAQGLVTVQANDSSAITAAAGGLAIAAGGSSVGFGLGISVDTIDNSVTASIDSAKVTGAGVMVNAASDAAETTVAFGIGLSASVGVAGAIASDNIDTGVTANIINGAAVLATDNVGVIAANANSIVLLASALGVGLDTGGVGIATAFNTVGGDTTATITGATTSVDALGDGNAVSVSNGELQDTSFGAADITAPGNSGSEQFAATLSSFDLTEQQKSVHGVAVNAASTQQINAVAAAAGLAFDPASAGIGATVVTDTMGGTTKASIEDAQINQQQTVAGKPQPNAQQTVDVTASSVTIAGNWVLGAGGGGFGGSAAVAQSDMDRTTSALISGATVNAAQAVSVTALSQEDGADFIVGFSAGGGAVGISGVLNTFDATTNAAIDGGTITTAVVEVGAGNADGLNASVVTVALGAVAIAGSFLVDDVNNTTTALIGDDTQATILNGVDTLSDTAMTATVLQSMVASGGGGGVGIAGMASLTSVSNDTEASLDGVELDQPTTDTPNPAGAVAVTVSALEGLDITGLAPVVSAGTLAGVGAGAMIVTDHSTVDASVVGSDINAAGGIVTVQAIGNKNIDLTSVTVAVGGTAGIGGAAALILVGSDPDGAPADAANEFANNSGGNGGTIDALNQFTTANGGAPVSLGSVDDSAKSDSITASIDAGTMTAVVVDVVAQGTLATSNTVGVGAGGLGGGVGGGVGITHIYDTVIATIDQGASVTAASVSVTAQMGDGAGRAVAITADVGVAASGLALEAAIGDATISDIVTASVSDATLTGASTSDLSVIAQDTTTATVNSVGVAVSAGLSVGAVINSAEKSSQVTASLAATALSYDGVIVAASNAGLVQVNGVASTGGVAAGTGVEADASDNANVVAYIDGGRVDSGVAGVMVLASDTPQVVADAFGVTVSGVGVGVSLASATASPAVSAAVTGGATIDGTGTLGVMALSTPATSDGTTASSNATAGTGALLVGVNATSSTAQEIAQTDGSGDAIPIVSATIGDGVTLPLGDVAVTATNISSQLALSTGIVGAGIVAVGRDESNAASGVAGGNANPTIASVSLGVLTTAPNGSVSGRAGALTISATSTDTNDAEGTAGAGGLGTSSAASSTVDSNTSTTAQIDGGTAGQTIYAGAVRIAAQHTDNYATQTDSTNAAAVGKSGADASATITPAVAANVAGSALVSASNLGIYATDTVNEPINSAVTNASGAAGGAITGTAVSSTDTVTESTTITIGSGAVLTTGGDPLANPGLIDIEAESAVNLADSVTLNTGGLISGAAASSTINATENNSITIAGATLNSNGAIQIGAITTADASTSTDIAIYGLAGGPTDGDSETNVTSSNTVTIGNGTHINALGNGNVNIFAGQSGDGSLNDNLYATATTGIVNDVLFAVDTDPKARTTMSSDNQIVLADNSLIQSVRDVSVGTYNGSLEDSAVDGTAHNLGLSLSGFNVDTVTHDGSSTPPVETNSIVLDGQIIAGIHHLEQVTVGPDGSIATTDSVAATSANNFDPGGTLANEITQAQQQLAADELNLAADDPQIVRDLSTIEALMVLAAKLPASGTTAPVVMVGEILAAGGNILIGSDIITTDGGTSAMPASLTAYGSPQILITNNSSSYLEILAPLHIPAETGGQLFSTGAAQLNQVTGLTLNEIVLHNIDGSIQAPQIIITEQPSSNTLSPPPSIFLESAITNQGGLVSITNTVGSLGLTGSIQAAQLNIDVPNGVVSEVVAGFDAIGSDPQASGAANPYSQFDPTNDTNLTNPDGGAVSGETVGIENLVALAVNAIFNSDQAFNQGRVPALGGVPSGVTDVASYILTNSLVNDVAQIGGTVANPLFGRPFDSQTFIGTLSFSNFSGNGTFTQTGLYQAVNAVRAGGIGLEGTQLTDYVVMSRPANSITNFTSCYSGFCFFGGNDAFMTANTGLDHAVINSLIFGPLPSAAYVQGGVASPNVTGPLSNGSTAVPLISANPRAQTPAGSGLNPVNITIPGASPPVGATALTGAGSTAPSTTPTPAISAQAVVITADTIDLAGNIVAGSQNNFSADFSNASVTSAIAADLHAYNANPTTVNPLFSITAPAMNPGDSPIAAQYDAQNNRIILSNVDAAGGGFVSLTGKIVSTVSNANITVNGGGYGNVQVNGAGSIPIVVQNIDTGEGAIGEVKITDTLKTVPGTTTPLTTWYISQPGQGVSTYENLNGANAFTAQDYFVAGAPVSSTASNTASYSPVAGALVQWVDSTALTRSYTEESDGQITIGAWKLPTGVTTLSPFTVGPESVAIGATNAPAFQQTVSATVGNGNTSATETALGNIIIGGGSEILSSTDSSVGRVNLDIIAQLSLSITTKVKADNPIGITFGGNASALVSIDATAPVTLTGTINNPGGPTEISAQSSTQGTPSIPLATITQTANASIIGNTIALEATGGIGTTTQPIVVNLVGDGASLTAVTTGGTTTDATGATVVVPAITISAPASALPVARVSAGSAGAYGNVRLSAAGHIYAATPITGIPTAPIVTGNNITLTSTGGGIGTINGGLPILAVAPAASGDISTGGVVNVTMAAGVDLIQINGDLRIGQVNSPNTDVTLTALNGNIVNANTSDALDASAQQQLAAAFDQLVNSLHLVDLAPGQPDPTNGQATITSLQNTVNAEYQSYWQLRDVAFANGSFNLNGKEAQFSAQALASLNETRAAQNQPPLTQVTNAQIDSYVQTQFSQLTSFLQSAFQVSDLSSLAQFSTYQPGYTFDVASVPGLAASLTRGGSVPLDALANVIDADPLTGPSPISFAQTPNVIGRNVTLVALNGGVGTDDGVTSFSLLQGQDLTTGEKALLAAAAPGDTTLTQPDAQTLVISVAQEHLFDVSATGTISSEAENAVFIGAVGNFAVGTGVSGNTVRLTVGGDITNTMGGSSVISATTADFSALGGIGAANDALRIDISSALNQAVANTGVYLQQAQGDLAIGNIQATSGAIAINVGDGNLLSLLSAQTPHIAGTSIDLQASGSLGTLDAPLAVALDGGVFVGSAGTGAFISAPSSGLDIQSLIASGPVSLMANGALILPSALMSSGDVTLLANGSISLGGAISATGAVTVNGLGDVVVQGLSGTDIDLTAGGMITTNDNVTALDDLALIAGGNIRIARGTLSAGGEGLLQSGGAIIGSGLGTIDVMTGKLGHIVLVATTGIGEPLVIETPLFTASTVTGDIDIEVVGDSTAPSVTDPGGNINLFGDGNFNFGTISGGGNISVIFDGTINGQTVKTPKGRVIISGAGGSTVDQITQLSSDARTIAVATNQFSLFPDGLFAAYEFRSALQIALDGYNWGELQQELAAELARAVSAPSGSAVNLGDYAPPRSN